MNNVDQNKILKKVRFIAWMSFMYFLTLKKILIKI